LLPATASGAKAALSISAKTPAPIGVLPVGTFRNVLLLVKREGASVTLNTSSLLPTTMEAAMAFARLHTTF
jgi:hypothetical protein